MAPHLWKGATAFLLVVVLLQFYLIASETRVPHVPGLSSKHDDHTSGTVPIVDSDLNVWEYDSARDHHNIGLSTAQCDSAFPDLYFEIERAATVWQEKKHTISRDDISIDWRKDGAFQALIVGNQLRVLKAKGTWRRPPAYHKRALYTLAQLNRALLGASAAGERLPDIEFAVTVDDMSLIPGEDVGDTHSIWAYTRNTHDRTQDRLWVIPDFNFYASPPRASSFIEQQRRAEQYDLHVVDKIPQAIWRGVKWTNEDVRGHLLEKTKGKTWADVEEINWDYPNNTMPMEDMCRYMFTVHTEGRSWSGRLKFLLNCDSVPIVHKLDWTSEFYHLLKADGPDQNHIPVKRDFSDLERKIKYYMENADEAQKIADNAVATFRSRYTSPAAESCYWRRLIKTYSENAFEPDLFETVRRNRSGTEIEEQQLRGITYEELLVLEDDGKGGLG
jgi:hypothetical protein